MATIRLTESEFKKAVNETIKEFLDKRKEKNILGYENDTQDETIPNDVNLGIVSINESKGNNIELSLYIGYNYVSNVRNGEKAIIDSILFNVLCKDKNNGFSDTIASYECSNRSDFMKDKYIAQVHTSNFWDDTDEIITQLGGGKRNDFAYEDEPEKVFKRSVCDIKPFVMEHLNEAIMEFKNNRYYPEWQKERAFVMLESFGALKNTLQERTTGKKE